MLSATLAGACPAASAPDVKPLSGLTVREAARCLGARRPADREVPPARVVDSYPAQGAVVRPGILVLRLTFDLPMACTGFLVDLEGRDNPCAVHGRDAVQSFDRRTIRIACELQPNTRYGVGVNTASGLRFISRAGWPAMPFELRFETSGAAPARTIRESLAEDPSPASDPK